MIPEIVNYEEGLRPKQKEVKKEEKSDALKEEIKKRDPMARSPLDALNYLIDLKKRVK